MSLLWIEAARAGREGIEHLPVMPLGEEPMPHHMQHMYEGED